MKLLISPNIGLFSIAPHLKLKEVAKTKEKLSQQVKNNCWIAP